MKIIKSILLTAITLYMSGLLAAPSFVDSDIEPNTNWNTHTVPPKKPMYHPLERTVIKFEKESLDIIELKQIITEISNNIATYRTGLNFNNMMFYGLINNFKLNINYSDKNCKAQYSIKNIWGNLFINIWSDKSEYIVEFTTHTTCKQLESFIFCNIRDQIITQLLNWSKTANHGYAISGDMASQYRDDFRPTSARLF